jgi:hypothetical protein
MRASQWFLGVATASSIMAAAAAGCSSSSSNEGGTDAATTDVVVDHYEAAPPMEAAAEAAPMEAGPEACAVDANLSTLMVPDASILDGGINLPECVSCMQMKCASQITACNADCACVTAVVDGLPCIQMYGLSLTMCGQYFTQDPAAQALGLCTAQGCFTQCGLNNVLPEAGPEGGEGGPTEAGTVIDAGGGG